MDTEGRTRDLCATGKATDISEGEKGMSMFDEGDVAIACLDAEQEWQKQQLLDREEQEICHALARVGAGLGGMKEAQVLAQALGPRFDNQERVTHE